jgi:hypothetical protein
MRSKKNMNYRRSVMTITGAFAIVSGGIQASSAADHITRHKALLGESETLVNSANAYINVFGRLQIEFNQTYRLGTINSKSVFDASPFRALNVDEIRMYNSDLVEFTGDANRAVTDTILRGDAGAYLCLISGVPYGVPLDEDQQDALRRTTHRGVMKFHAAGTDRGLPNWPMVAAVHIIDHASNDG